MKSEVIVLDLGIFLRERSVGPKQSLTNSHNDRKIDGAKLLLSLIIAILEILMHFNLFIIYEEIIYLTHFCTHCLSIPVREFRSVQA